MRMRSVGKYLGAIAVFGLGASALAMSTDLEVEGAGWYVADAGPHTEATVENYRLCGSVTCPNGTVLTPQNPTSCPGYKFCCWAYNCETGQTTTNICCDWWQECGFVTIGPNKKRLSCLATP